VRGVFLESRAIVLSSSERDRVLPDLEGPVSVRPLPYLLGDQARVFSRADWSGILSGSVSCSEMGRKASRKSFVVEMGWLYVFSPDR